MEEMSSFLTWDFILFYFFEWEKVKKFANPVELIRPFFACINHICIILDNFFLSINETDTTQKSILIALLFGMSLVDFVMASRLLLLIYGLP